MALLFLSFFIFASKPQALVVEDVSYDIPKYVINANVNVDGSMDVEENITLDGSFNGFFREILYKNSQAPAFVGKNSDFNGNKIYDADDITNIKVSANQQSLTKVSYASKGQSGVYTMTSGIDGYKITMYQPTDGQELTFQIQYQVKNAVVVHNDVAELFWTFIGTQFEDDIQNLAININLPGDSKDLKVWAHGPLSGDINIVSQDKVSATVPKLYSKTKVDTRIVFDKSLVPSATKLSNINGLDKILSVEKVLADQANAKRKVEKIWLYGLGTISVLLTVALLALTIWFNTKYRPDKKAFTMQYHRELVNQNGPEILYYLLYKNINEKALTAALLDLVRKRVYKVEEVPSNKKKKDFKLTLLPHNITLKASEAHIVEWLTNDIGNGEYFTTKDMEAYNKKISQAEHFTKQFERYKDLVYKEAGQYNYFINHTKEANFITLLGIFAFIVGIIDLVKFGDSVGLYGILLIIIGIICIVFVNAKIIRTKEGNLEYQKWLAFKRFLLDFGRMNEKELPEIALWEEYLVYATALGIADKVSEAMEIKVKEFGYDSDMYLNTWTFFYLTHGSFGSSFGNSFSHAVESSAAIASSTMSSASGGGGGFSGGGGSGGGGGGGGGGGF